MSAPPFMPLYVGDYLADTTHLTVTEHGAYMLLLMSMWRNGGSLPNDDKSLARHARCTRGQWDRMRPVLIEFFEATDRTITQGRLAKELTKHTEAVRQQRERSSNGGKAKALKSLQTDLPPAPVRQCQPEPEPEKNIEANASLSSAPPAASPMTYPEPFEAAWKAYPHVKGRSSKPKALGYWRRLSPATRQALPSAVARYARDGREPKAECGAPAMQRWLADARFADWMPEAESSAGVWTDDRWSAVVALNRDEGWWSDNLGPRPGEPGCRVPAHLIDRQAA